MRDEKNKNEKIGLLRFGFGFKGRVFHRVT